MTKPYRLSTTTPVLAYFQITEPIIPKPPTVQHKPAIFSSQFQNDFAKIHISAVHIVALTNDIFPQDISTLQLSTFLFPLRELRLYTFVTHCGHHNFDNCCCCYSGYILNCTQTMRRILNSYIVTSKSVTQEKEQEDFTFNNVQFHKSI
jgi:hypothetical protein